MSNNKYFFCYDYKLASFLNSKKIRYITKAINPNSNMFFWLYEQTEELSNSIKEFKKN